MIRQSLRLAALAAAAATAGLVTMPAVASPASSATVASVTGRAGAARLRPWIAITSLRPGFAQPTGKVTVSGIVANPTGSALRGMTVQLWSSAVALPTRQAMSSYLAAPEPTGLDQPIAGAVRDLPSPVPAHGTEKWSLTLTAGEVGIHSFGVYPLAAQLGNITGPVDDDRTFLPFWPGKPETRTLKPLSIAWIWPLIDTPQQTPCRALTTNEIAGSIAAGGRLNSLLAAGQTAGRQALLTWAIDPALISDVSVMTGPYHVAGSHRCAGGRQEPPSSAAKAWLAGVQAVAAQQDFFTTPYADVDLAALDRSSLNDEVKAAFADGRLAAVQTKILGRAIRSTPEEAGPIAWPAGGIANYGDLQGLAAPGIGIRTVILNSTMMRPHERVSYTPGAVTTIPSGLGSEMTILLADNTLTQILSARRTQIPGLVPAAYSTPSGGRPQARQAAAFAKEQWFLAETAMIASQPAPVARSVVVAPPSRWNPAPGLASDLLTETGNAPWLRPASLAGLASTPVPHGQVGFELPRSRAARGELSDRLLRQVKRLHVQIQLLGSILSTHGNGYLSTAVDTVASSAWRGDRADQRRAGQIVHRDLAYVLGQLRQVKIVGSSRVTLGGQNGVVPVSISNGLSHSVTVELIASAPSADHLVIGKSSGGKSTRLVTVQGHTQRTIKIPVTAAQAGSTTLTLRLATASGTLLPVESRSLTVAATHFGTLAIVIISIALVVFVITAAARAIRHGSDPADGDSGDEAGSGPSEEAEGLDTGPSAADLSSSGGETDSVVPRGADERQPAKEADEHASTPGRADRS